MKWHAVRAFAAMYVVLITIWATSQIGEDVPAATISWWSAWRFIAVNVFCIGIGYLAAKAEGEKE
jgi:hypothetical protein